MIQVRGRLKRAGCVIINNYSLDYHRYGTKSCLYIDERYAGCLPPVRPPREHRLGSCTFDDYDEMLQSLADGPIWGLQMERKHGLLLVPVVLSGDGGHDQSQYRRVGYYKISHEEPEENSWFDDCGEEDTPRLCSFFFFSINVHSLPEFLGKKIEEEDNASVM